MITMNKTDLKSVALWFTILIIILVLFVFGSTWVQWIMMKLYEFFIEKNVTIKIILYNLTYQIIL
jgi:hypothetical protein